MPYKNPEQQRQYQREWRAKRRADYFADKACVICDTTDRLELDHIDPSKKVAHSIWSWSDERRLAELAKCQVLCVTHHRQKTNAQLRSKAKHGERNRYRGGCRCTPCTEANTQYQAARRAAIRAAA